MAQQLDQFPVYDPVTEKGDRLSALWRDFMGTFYQNLIGYLTQYGLIVPPLTTAQRNTIQSPEEGQLIRNSDRKTLQVYLNGGWQEITTTPAP